MAQDYRSVVSYKERPEKLVKSGIVQPRWWELGEDELSQAVVDVGERLLNDSGERHATMVRHARLYENCDFDTIVGRDYSAAVVQNILTGAGVMSLNVGASCVDTLTAKVTKNRPAVRILTSGGDWAMQRKGRALEKWCRGYIYETDVHEAGRQVFVDGCEFGTGFLQVYPGEDKKLRCERVLPHEILIDDMDGQYGKPRQLVRLKYVAREVLTRMFPEHAEAIAESGKANKLETPKGSEEVADATIEVWEAWHLPSGEKAKDGKHVIVIDGCVLFEERWNVCKFPFVVYRFKKRTAGFWGKGVIETVQPIQVELNRVVRSISQQMRRKGKGRTFVQVGSKVVSSHMTNNDGGDIVQYVGTPPIVDSGNAIAQEEFNYVLQLRQQAFQEVGISELSAAAKKPSGLDAAVALREYNDIESERFAPQHQDWERFFRDFIELSIDLITEQYGWSGYKVMVPGRRNMLQVDWENVNLQRDDYVMQLFPASSLPQTPAAKYQAIKERVADGMLSKTVAQRLLDYPDLEAETNLANAALDDADATISAILDDDEPELKPLEPYQNLDLIIERATAAYLFARHTDCEEERLTLLRNLIDNATKQKVALTMPPPAPPGAMPGAGAPPMPGGPSVAPPPMPGGGPSITNTLNVPPPIIPTVPPIVSG